MTAICLVEGPVGAGKSTFASRLARQSPGVHIALDEWFVRLFSPDRPDAEAIAWYMQRKARLLDLIWHHALALLAAGASPILELGLIRRSDRAEFYERAGEMNVNLSVYVLDAARDIRRQRVRERNTGRSSTFSMVVPDNVFETASDLWEPPDAIEIAQQRIRVIRTEEE